MSVSNLVHIDAVRGLASIGQEPHIFHCHHYNCFLQKSIMEMNTLFDTADLLTSAATAVTFAQFEVLSPDAALATELFSTLGFGVLDLSGVHEGGGRATLSASHYAMGWLSKFGRADGPVCFFPAGYVEGFARSTFRRPFTARETSCVARGDARCVIELTPGGRSVGISPGMGRLDELPARPKKATDTSVDEAAIVAACSQLPLAGNAEGKIDAFGVSLTRHYANYYNLISFRFDQQMMSLAGEAAALAARMLLVEAGHVCAFNTFGGIMESAEWDALIAPQCKTRQDWAYGLVSVVNALGWGRWSIAELDPGRRLEVVVDGSYESSGYLGLYGTSTTPRCYLATGGTAGVMNLLYNADITQRPNLTPEFYAKTFKSGALFTATEVECRAMGASQCRFIAERL
jgi:hypothetical protein